MCVNNKHVNITSNPEDLVVNLKKREEMLRKSILISPFFYGNMAINKASALNASKTQLGSSMWQPGRHLALYFKCKSSGKKCWGVTGQAGEWGPGPSAPEIPVPPAAAAGRFPDPRAAAAAEKAPSDAAPPAAWRENTHFTEMLPSITPTPTRLVQTVCISHMHAASSGFIHTLVSLYKP